MRGTHVQVSVVLRGARAVVGVSRINLRAATGSGCMGSLPALSKGRLSRSAESGREAD
jgi:hypothetical protein